MNSESENKLSMDELMERNRPAHTPQPSTQNTPSSVDTQCPIPETLDKLEHRLRNLERNSSGQTEYLRQMTELRGWLPTRMQVEELTKAARELRWTMEQVGRQNEQNSSRKRFRLPGLRLPHLSPALLLIPAVMAVLWVIWYSLDILWNGINMLAT